MLIKNHFAPMITQALFKIKMIAQPLYLHVDIYSIISSIFSYVVYPMEEEVSKSQKKREADVLQKIGVQLIELSPSKLASLPLPDNLFKAISDARTIKSHGAKRRQAQLIGKLMRAADHDAIVAAYEQIIAEDSAVTAGFHELEVWRDKLITGGKDALTEFFDLCHPEEFPQLRQLIKKAVDDKQNDKNTGAAKALFRYLRSSIK